jgi:hypothetical protein
VAEEAVAEIVADVREAEAVEIAVGAAVVAAAGNSAETFSIPPRRRSQ